MLPLPQVIELFTLPTEFGELPDCEPARPTARRRSPASVFDTLAYDLLDPRWAATAASQGLEAIPH